MTDVCHYSDDFNLARVVPGNGKALPKRILGAEERLRSSPIQDANVRSAETILISEIPAHQHRNAHGPEIIGHHDRDVAGRTVRALARAGLHGSTTWRN